MSSVCAESVGFFKSFVPNPNQRISNRTHIAATLTIAAAACASLPLAVALGAGYITASLKWNSRVTSVPPASQKVQRTIAPLTSMTYNGEPSERSEMLEIDSKEHKGLRGFKKYKALCNENQLPMDRQFIIPTRRVCGFGGMESTYTLERARNSVFVSDSEILKIHPMRFLRNSPFVQPINEMCERFFQSLDDTDSRWESLYDTLINTQLHAIGLTENGKHVILQQAVKSCVPSCVAMLVLDHGKTPNYEAIKTTNLANEKDAIKWVRDAGLNPEVTNIGDSENAAQILQESIQRHGSGILSINHPEIGGHVIVLDEISTETNSAVIRDSCHGRCLTVKLDSLLSWLYKYSDFLQIRSD